jgi:Recombination endonuclease VII
MSKYLPHNKKTAKIERRGKVYHHQTAPNRPLMLGASRMTADDSQYPDSVGEIKIISKECGTCRTVKPLSEFSPQALGRLKVRAHCKVCRRKPGFRPKRPIPKIDGGSSRWAHLWVKYKITKEDFDAMLERQGGCCAICGSHQSRGRHSVLSVDHCHETGAVRGLLCTPCNSALGVLGDTAEKLRKAVDYLSLFSKGNP